MIRRLEAATEQEQLPKDDRELVFATRLLQLAAGCRAMMRERQYRFAGGHGTMAGLLCCVGSVGVREQQHRCAGGRSAVLLTVWVVAVLWQRFTGGCPVLLAVCSW